LTLPWGRIDSGQGEGALKDRSMLRRLALAALCAAFAGAAVAQTPSPAPPPGPVQIARCWWSALPNTTRAALVKAGPGIDDIGKAVTAMSPSLIALAESQCPIPSSRQVDEAAKDAWAGVVMTSWAEGRLKADYGVSQAALTRAWARVPASERRALIAGFDQTPEAVRPHVASFAASLKLTDPTALDLLSAWAIAELRLAGID
jgi:hypothetical protein